MVYGTGLSGFVGKHLVEQIPDIVSIPHDKISSTKLKDCDRFFFLSSYGNMSFQTEDDKILKANITDLVDVLIQINWDKIKSFVFISTSSVKLPIQTMYSRCKRAAEEILLSFAEKYKVPICIIRPFSITGAGEQKEHLIPKLIESCLVGSPMDFVGEPCHDYIDVRDVVDGILKLSQAGARGIFELGSGKSYSNQEVLEIVERITGRKAKISPGVAKPYDTKMWCSTNFRTRGYGWTPEIKLEDTIKDMIKTRPLKEEEFQ
jgi:nucleoside-diphosphate-sugar epimerase